MAWRVKAAGIRVLSLFFIDRVGNYLGQPPVNKGADTQTNSPKRSIELNVVDLRRLGHSAEESPFFASAPTKATYDRFLVRRRGTGFSGDEDTAVCCSIS